MKMEAGQRRLALICSHLQPSLISSSLCSSRTIDDGLNNVNNSSNLEDDCVFCGIVRGQSPAFKLYEDDMFLCILDTSPLSHGHSLLIPKLHYCSLDATPPNVIAAMCSKIPLISNAIKKVTGCDSFNLLVNNGAAAGQVIFHTHIHIIPRKVRDRLWASESLKRLSLKLDEEASQLAESIRQHLSEADTKTETEDFKGHGSNLPAAYRD